MFKDLISYSILIFLFLQLPQSAVSGFLICARVREIRWCWRRSCVPRRDLDSCETEHQGLPENQPGINAPAGGGGGGGGGGAHVVPEPLVRHCTSGAVWCTLVHHRTSSAPWCSGAAWCRPVLYRRVNWVNCPRWAPPWSRTDQPGLAGLAKCSNLLKLLPP